MVQARAKCHREQKICNAFSIILGSKTTFSPKIDRIMADSILNFKGAWRAHFLSPSYFQNHHNFQRCFNAIIRIFYLSHGLGDGKIGTHCSLYLLSTSLIDHID